MKKLVLLFAIPLVFSCASYETVTVVDATPVYSTKKADQKAIVTIPANTEVQLKGKKKVKKVKYKTYEGFVVAPNYGTKTIVKKTVPTP